MAIPTGADTIESRADAFKDAGTTFRYWLNAWDLASDQEKDWRETSADAAVRIYRADKSHPRAFNILHSNVETICPALYNSTPDPDVRTRDKKKDPLARKGAQIIEMTLRYQIDEYDFDSVCEGAVHDMQVPGRGQARVRYKPYMHSDQETGEKVVWEEALCEMVPWRSFRHGPGASWAEVPWVGYELFLTRDELVKLCRPQPEAPGQPVDPLRAEEAEKMAREIPLDVVDAGTDDKNKTNREKSVFKKARVYEIWDKETRQVFFVAPGYDKGPLRIEPDPLGFLDFFDCPPPLQAIKDTETLTPVTPYDVYREQAEELNKISERILKLITALKYRGIRASEIPELDKIEELADLEFAPSEGAMAVLGGGKALEDGIWAVPIDKLIQTVVELARQREGVKQVIYEITGIADVLRGASNPNETLGAQQIKAQWGSLRVNKQQRAVQRFVRDILRLKSEIIANKFQKRTLEAVIGEPIDDQVMQLLRSDARRCYMIDIETDSTIRGDLARAQENFSGWLQSSAQFFQTFVPLIQSGRLPPQLGQAAVVIYGAFCRQFKLGKVVEDTLEKLEQAAAQMPMGEKTPEEQQREAEADEMNKASQEAVTRKTNAQAAQIETETAMGEPMPPAPDVPPQVKAAKEIAEGAKRIAETDKVQAETQAQRLESAIVAQQGSGPGFVQ